MKTIANVMIINSQNVKPEHLVISSHHNISFQRRKLCLPGCVLEKSPTLGYQNCCWMTRNI